MTAPAPAGPAGDVVAAWVAAGREAAVSLGQVEVEGCGIAHRSWGQPGRPGLVLVHGGAAHARWWDHLGPVLASGASPAHVVALDLSGHGDSRWRDAYGLDVWAREVLAVAGATGMAGAPVVVGHSMGGFVAMAAAALHGDQLAGAVVVDAPVRRPDPESAEGRRGRVFRSPKTYPTLEAAMARFSLVPSQPAPPPALRDHVARTSLRQVADGWTWKFDPAVFVRRRDPHADDYGELLERVRCRLAVVHGEHSAVVDPAVRDYMAERLGRAAPFVEIPEAHHHLILDQPVAFVAALRALLADWEHSSPHRIPGLPLGLQAPR